MVVIAQASPSLAWGAEPAGSAYVWAFRNSALTVEALDRATTGPEVRYVLSDRSTVALRVVGVGGGLSASVTGNVLRVGPVTLTMEEAGGMRLRARYDLLASVKPANNTVSWTVTTSGGASVAMLAGGVLSLRNAAGVEEATQVAPTATDKDGAAVVVTATLVNGTLTYTLQNIANNRYPVTIDPTTVSTSTQTTATARSMLRLVHVASTGDAIVFYHSGSNWQWRSAASPYSSWSSATAVTNATRDLGLTAVMDGSNHVHVVYRTASGPNLCYRKLTFSAGAWTLGSETTVASGDYGGGGEHLSSAIDVDGRMWVLSYRYNAGSTAETFYSAAGPNGTSWTASLTASFGGYGSAVLARAGDYIVLVRADSGTLLWRRANTSGSVGSWSSESTKSGTGTWGDHQIVALADVNSRLVVAAVPNNTTDYAIRTISYQPGTDAWDTGTTDIGTAATDRNPALARVGDDIYCVWSEYSASNSYAIAYKKWTASSATWGSKVTLVAAGANRLYVNAGGNTDTLAALWTAGTGSPYDVVFEYAYFGGGAVQDTPELRMGRFGMRQLLAQ